MTTDFARTRALFHLPDGVDLPRRQFARAAADRRHARASPTMLPTNGASS